VTLGSRKDKTKTHHKRTVFEDERWMEISQGSCVMVRSVIRDNGSSYSAATLIGYLDSEEFHFASKKRLELLSPPLLASGCTCVYKHC
jgi:hypothetical protein